LAAKELDQGEKAKLAGQTPTNGVKSTPKHLGELPLV